MPAPARTREAIKALIREHGPMTTEDLADELGMLKSTVSSCISTARKTPEKHFYIKSYVPQIGRAGLPAGLFALGNRRDASPPETDRRAIGRRSYRNNKAVIKARRSARAPSPFKSMLTQLVTS